MIICAGNNEIFTFAKPIGVGLVSSSIKLTRMILENPVDSLLFVGSAGSYGKHGLFDIVHSQSASNYELGALDKLSYTPVENEISLEKTDNVPRETLHIVNSSNYITSNLHSAKQLEDIGIHLENMEFYAVLHVAKKFNIPAKGIFIITNYCFENARKEFLQNHNKAKDLLENYLYNKRIINE